MVTLEEVTDANIRRLNSSGINCYGYAFTLNVQRSVDPGELSGMPVPPDMSACNDIIMRVLRDERFLCGGNCSVQYLGDNVNIRHYEQPNETLVYMCVDTKRPDYHFYKKMPSPSNHWLHKPGQQGIRLTDGAGEMITDPRMADHNYVEHDYSLGCGFFLLRKK